MSWIDKVDEKIEDKEEEKDAKKEKKTESEKEEKEKAKRETKSIDNGIDSVVVGDEIIAQGLIRIFEFIIKAEIMMTGEFGDQIPDEFFQKYGGMRDEYLGEETMKNLPIQLKTVEKQIFEGEDVKGLIK